jgi:predicted PurR-regulated permease PerM
MSALTLGRFRFAPVLAATVITVLLLMLLGSAAKLFLLLFIAVLISLYLGALADVLVARAHAPRRLALALAILITLALMVGFGWLLFPPVVEQTQALIRTLPDRIVRWENALDVAIARVPALRGIWPPGEHKLLLAAYQEVSGYFGQIVPKLVGVVDVAIEVVSVAIMGIYLAIHPGLYREYLIALFPPVHRDLVRNVLGDLSRTLRAWIVGQLSSMMLLGALTAIGLNVIGVPFWLTFGIFSGVVAIVPFFGTLISTLLPALFVLGVEGGPAKALLVIIWGIIVHLIEGNLVSPLIMSRQVQLPPVMTIMAVLIMGKLLGPIGLLVAVPTLAVLDVVVRRILINRIYEGQGFRRLVRDSAFVVRAPVSDGDVLLPQETTADVLALAEERQRTRVA